MEPGAERQRLNDADVAVIGGGPAGSTAARLLKLWGHSVVLVHRRGPSPALGESLPPSCAGLLDRIGVHDAVDQAGFIRSTGNTVSWGPDEVRPRVETFAEGRFGYQVLRPDFDRLLRRCAAEAGVPICEGTVSGVVQRADGQLDVIWARDASPEHLRATWVLDCSGRAGVLSRRAGRTPEPGVRTLALVGTWERPDGWSLPDATHTVVESFPGGWGWSVPISEIRRCVAVMVDPLVTGAGPRRDAIRRLVEAELGRTRLLGPMLAGAVAIDRPFACDASSYSSARCVQGRVMHVGDAASFIDPLSSFGVKKALASAWLAAVCVHSSLTTPDVEEAASVLFAEREDAYVTAARKEFGAVSRETRQADPFWESRAAVGDEAAEGLDAESLRRDPAVLAAFAELKSRPVAGLVRGSASVIRDRAVINGNLIELRPHYQLPSLPGGLRYLRNIDLFELTAIALAHSDVGEMYEAYCSRVATVPLPDFLGALSTMIARGILRFA